MEKMLNHLTQTVKRIILGLSMADRKSTQTYLSKDRVFSLYVAKTLSITKQDSFLINR
jgi:hypothetical protein